MRTFFQALTLVSGSNYLGVFVFLFCLYAHPNIIASMLSKMSLEMTVFSDAVVGH